MKQLSFPDPRARRTDPDTSALAAQAIKHSNARLVGEIRQAVREFGPMTQEEIADVVCRYDAHALRSSVISACARADLVPVARTRNVRGREVHVWDVALSVEATTPDARYL